MNSAEWPSPEVQFRPVVFPRDEAAFMAHLRALYPSINEATRYARLEEVRQGTWACIGAFAGDAKRTMVGAAGYWIQNRLCWGRFLYVDFFIVSRRERCFGVGRHMWKELERVARDHGCRRIILDTAKFDSPARRFVMKLGCSILGLSFGKTLSR
jgi:GNAT superfamily N-acetyltransferase